MSKTKADRGSQRTGRTRTLTVDGMAAGTVRQIRFDSIRFESFPSPPSPSLPPLLRRCIMSVELSPPAHAPVYPADEPQHVRFHIEGAADAQGMRREATPAPVAETEADFGPDPLANAPLLLSFRGMCVSSSSPARYLLRNVSGGVRAGGLTALVGASGSGKTLLLQLLSGRLAGSSLSSRGSMRVAGRAVPLNGGDAASEHGPVARIGFVAQEDHLIGEITVRETFRFAAQLRLSHSVSEEQREKEISDLIDGLGLTHVADNVIGTVLRRGLSGGEKRRVSVGVELAARPTVICLDGSTDGLDASSAYEVLRSVQRLARGSNGQLCVLASIHQPNSRLLHLFDDMLVLGRGGSVYFGPVREAAGYFRSIGFPPPQHQTITDYVLHIVDTRFRTPATRPTGANNNNNKNQAKRSGGTQLQLVAERKTNALAAAAAEDDDGVRAADVDFPLRFELSAEAARMHARFQAEDHAAAQCGSGISHDAAAHPRYLTSWREQFVVLTNRFAMVARRDLTLYILQFVLCAGFGFMVGVEFWQLPRLIGTRLQDVTNGIVWLVFVASYLQVRHSAVGESGESTSARDLSPFECCASILTCVCCVVLCARPLVRLFVCCCLLCAGVQSVLSDVEQASIPRRARQQELRRVRVECCRSARHLRLHLHHFHSWSRDWLVHDGSPG